MSKWMHDGCACRGRRAQSDYTLSFEKHNSKSRGKTNTARLKKLRDALPPPGQVPFVHALVAGYIIYRMGSFIMRKFFGKNDRELELADGEGEDDDEDELPPGYQHLPPVSPVVGVVTARPLLLPACLPHGAHIYRMLFHRAMRLDYMIYTQSWLYVLLTHGMLCTALPILLHGMHRHPHATNTACYHCNPLCTHATHMHACSQLVQGLLPTMLRASLPKPKRKGRAQRAAELHHSRPRSYKTAHSMMHPGTHPAAGASAGSKGANVAKQRPVGKLEKMDILARQQVRSNAFCAYMCL